MQRGTFAATAFQKLQRLELIKAHSETGYHQAAAAKASDFMRTLKRPEAIVEADKTSKLYYKRNRHVLEAIAGAG